MHLPAAAIDRRGTVTTAAANGFASVALPPAVSLHAN